MGKSKNPRRVAENEAQAISKMLKTSPQKLNLVAGMIRNKPVGKALSDLTFSKRRVAVDVKKTLQSAIANAENNHGLDVDELIVADCDLDDCNFYKETIFDFARHRRPEHYGRITSQTGVILPE